MNWVCKLQIIVNLFVSNLIPANKKKILLYIKIGLDRDEVRHLLVKLKIRKMRFVVYSGSPFQDDNKWICSSQFMNHEDSGPSHPVRIAVTVLCFLEDVKKWKQIKYMFLIYVTVPILTQIKYRWINTNNYFNLTSWNIISNSHHIRCHSVIDLIKNININKNLN